MFLHGGSSIGIPHMSIDPLSDRADLVMLTLKSFVLQMPKPAGFIDWPSAPTVQVVTDNNDSFFNKRSWHAESVSRLKWQTCWRLSNFNGELFSTTFMQVKANSHSQRELVPDKFEMSSNQIVSETRLIFAARYFVDYVSRGNESCAGCDTSVCTLGMPIIAHWCCWGFNLMLFLINNWIKVSNTVMAQFHFSLFSTVCLPLLEISQLKNQNIFTDDCIV